LSQNLSQLTTSMSRYHKPNSVKKILTGTSCQSMLAERERPICRLALKPIFVTPAMRSAPAPLPLAPRSALAQAFSGMSAHRSAAAHSVFCPLPAISAPLSAHMCCSYARLGEALSAVAPETELVQSSHKHVFIIYLFAQKRQL